MSLQTRLITPLDILMLRGNKSFGDSGEHGVSSMPPSPSVLAGALRSFWLAELGCDLAKFSRRDRNNPAKPEEFAEPICSQLGTPAFPRGFRLAGSGLMRQHNQQWQRLYPLPADLVLQKNAKNKDDTHPTLYALKPALLPNGLWCNLGENSYVPLLQAPPGKPESGYWLTEAGYHLYLQGELPPTSEWIKSSVLWKSDWRLGIALDSDKRTTGDGQLYTTEAIALHDSIRLFVDIEGAPDYPANGNLRLGGDGRGASFDLLEASVLPSVIPNNGKLKLILSSPAIFKDGWQLPTQDANGRIQFEGGSARVVTASVPRHHVVSGWDLANWCPKAAERVVPAGSVYWLDEIQTNNPASLPTALQDLLLGDTDPQRRAEGYNACHIGHWII